ncbi:MAG: response regulator [Flavobacteriaceae bacterium]
MQLKVLSVDDSAAIAAHLKCLFNSFENITFTGHAFTINEAKTFMKSDSPDVVILDIALKDENGMDFLAYLKNNHAEVKVIMLSNQAGLFYKNKSKEMGADYFLDKSYEFDKLPDILNELKSG